MRCQISIFSLLTTLLITGSPIEAEVNVGPEIRRQISEILRKPAVVYQLDLKQNESHMAQIDAFFGRYLDLKKSTPRQSRLPDRTTLAVAASKPISVSPESTWTAPMGPAKAPAIQYVKEPQRRIFRKEVAAPTKNTLPEGRVIELARQFVEKNRLARFTPNDRPFSSQVLARQRQPFRPELKAQEMLTLFQSAQFGRQFASVEVLNSRISVDIHPDSGEVLSFRLMHWTPVNEASGKTVPSVSESDVLRRISGAFARSRRDYEVVKVKPAMYEGTTTMFPVLVVYTRPVEDSKYVPEERALIVSLVDNRYSGLQEKKHEWKRPGQARPE